ncbi:hypothetical protein BLS_003359 [Venturia inaequalis]|uniref:Uncharacterized protein n=1 Tax=Venturia inaequalis TaxID=5025 RepID=A0A8H3V7K9_VENIN|nr:hypothetical protein BLS_003359 [Venturia inaequalis]
MAIAEPHTRYTERAEQIQDLVAGVRHQEIWQGIVDDLRTANGPWRYHKTALEQQSKRKMDLGRKDDNKEATAAATQATAEADELIHGQWAVEHHGKSRRGYTTFPDMVTSQQEEAHDRE